MISDCEAGTGGSPGFSPECKGTKKRAAPFRALHFLLDTIDFLGYNLAQDKG